MENAALRVLLQLYTRPVKSNSAAAAWEPFKSLVESARSSGSTLPAPIAGKLCDSTTALHEFFQFGKTDEFLHGLAGLARNGLTRSMEEEARTNDSGRWWEEYVYVVERKAVEDVDLASTAKFAGKVSLTGEQIVRDRGHAGMRLQDFHNCLEAREAELTEAEVAAIRLYTGPLYAPLNTALRKLEIASWATTIACCYSGVLKLSLRSAPMRVYRGVREESMGLPPHFASPAIR